MSTTAREALTDTRLNRTFAQAKAEDRPVMMPFVTVGYPEIGDTERIIPALIEGGADMIEIGIPFSDPIADGPTIQRVSQQALDNGVTTKMAFDTVRRVREEQHVDAPLLFMGYYNPILAYGLEAYTRDCAKAGIDGLIVPDLPPEESDPLLDACIRHGIHLIYFLAPTSTPERAEAVLQRANGFIYVIALTGVTGARAHLQSGLAEYLSRVRRYTDLPLAIGFGISTREHVVAVENQADGVIFASALLESLGRTPSEDLPAEARRFVEMLRGRT